MNWLPVHEKPKLQRSLFIELTPDEQIIFDLLNGKEQVHIDEINFNSKLSSSSVASALLTLELQGVVASLPGKMYKVV
jgi:DNA processing protein